MTEYTFIYHGKIVRDELRPYFNDLTSKIANLDPSLHKNRSILKPALLSTIYAATNVPMSQIEHTHRNTTIRVVCQNPFTIDILWGPIGQTMTIIMVAKGTTVTTLNNVLW